MGKTNLIPSLTYSTQAEYQERKVSAKAAGLSISNFNRASMGYAAFKQGKPKKKAVMAEPVENSISFETVFVSAEKDGNPGNVIAKTINNPIKNSIENLKDYLPTEADVEDTFSNLLGISGSEKRVKTSAVNIFVEEKIIETSTERITEKAVKIEQEDFDFQNDNNLQRNLFA